MDIEQTINALQKILKPMHSVEIQVEQVSVDDTGLFFSKCEKLGFIPIWNDNGNIRVTNCAGLSKEQKILARLTSSEFSKLHSLIIEGGISMTMNGRHNRFRIVVGNAKGSENFMKLCKLFSKARNGQIDKVIDALFKFPCSVGDLAK